MTLLILGLALWWAAHLFKRVAPEARARMGDGGRGAVALALLVSVVLMVIGYRSWHSTFLWGHGPAMTGVNNLFVLLAFYLFAASGMKTRVTRMTRHPQLTAIVLWAIAHLLVNGDVASLVLFGGLLVWAVVEMAVINRAVPEWTPPEPAPLRKEITAIVAAVVIFGIVAMIHSWLGYYPFGG